MKEKQRSGIVCSHGESSHVLNTGRANPVVLRRPAVDT